MRFGEMRGKATIGGIGHTAFGKLAGRSTVSLNVEACRKTLADAKIEKGLVDAVPVKTPTSAREFMYGQKLAEGPRRITNFIGPRERLRADLAVSLLIQREQGFALARFAPAA